MINARQQCWAGLLGLCVVPGPASADEPFRRLTRAEIQSRFTGMELTDETHWSYRFEKAGRLASFSTGRAGTGAWRVENDELCLNREVDGLRCLEVWILGKRVELRREPGPPDEGILQRPQARSGDTFGRELKGEGKMRKLTLAVVLGLSVGTPAWAAEGWQQQIASGLGKPGTEMPGGVYRVGLPRTDLHVVLDGVEIKPILAWGSWLAFHPMGNDVMVMGDLVLTEDEINPVMKRLEDGGVEITALHNHLLRSSPATMYMHVHGHGEPTKLATTLREALGASKTPFGGETVGGSQTQPAPAPAPAALDLDTAMIAR